MKVKLNTSYIDCTGNQDILCPYCGHKQMNSWEKAPDEDNDNVLCGACEREFYVSKYIDVTYTSMPNDKTFRAWEAGDVSEDGLDNMEDEDWANKHGAQSCEVVQFTTPDNHAIMTYIVISLKDAFHAIPLSNVSLGSGFFMSIIYHTDYNPQAASYS